MKLRPTPFVITVLPALLLIGCQTAGPLHPQFGESVQALQAQQRYTPPDAEQHPLGHGPVDGDRAAAILKTYRGDVSKPQEVRDEIRIRIGG